MLNILKNDCSAVKENLPDYLRGSLSESESKRIEEHLRHCVSCQAEVREMREALGSLASEKSSVPPESYWRNFLPRLHDRLSEKEVPRIAPWMEKYLIPSLGLLAVILVIARVQIVPPSLVASSEVRKILAEMSTEELQQVVKSPTALPVQPSSEHEIIVLEGNNLPNDEVPGELIRSLLGVSMNEVHLFTQVNLLGSAESGFEALTDEEAETVLKSLQTAGSI